MSVDQTPLTLAEFVAWEARQSSKHEFRDGAVYAVAGATDDHSQVVANLMAIVRPALRGGPCRVYANDMMLVTDFPGSRYPDLMVTCDGRDAVQRRQKRYPSLIIEVLSQSTAGVDASEKLDEYQTIETLDEYVLVDSRKPSIRIYRRSGELFETSPATISGDVRLASLNLTLPLPAVYEDVDFTRIRGDAHSPTS